MKKLAFWAFALCALHAQEGSRRILPAISSARRLALVIGNQTYPRKPLRNSVGDARSMDTLLRRDLNFEVQRLEDAPLAAMQRGIRDFVRKVRPGDVALFYYSGHGMQVGGVNWMVPVDFRADFEDEVPDQAFSAQRVLNDLEEAGAAVRILILDACRDNPLPAAGRRSARDGLATMTGAEGTYILFATAENRTADDNPRGTNGLFTSFLVEAMRKPGITLDEAFKETRREVAAASNGRQRPWLATDIDRDVVLRPVAASGVPTPRLDAATEAWALIKGSPNAEDFEQFAALFPNSDLAAAAKLRAAQLRRSAMAAGGTTRPPVNTDAVLKQADQFYNAKNYAAALPLYRQAADAGHARSMRVVAYLYDEGLGVKQDYVEAMRWYRKAADAGDATALANIGWFYDNGLGVTQDYAEAMRWYRKAADAGNGAAMNNIGALYGNGQGVKQDHVEAMRWYRKAADAGDALAMKNIGWLYDRGLGVTQDYPEAIRWYRKGADGGNAAAMNNIGWLYENGQGVIKNRQTAIEWYRKAAAGSNEKAKENLKRLGVQ